MATSINENGMPCLYFYTTGRLEEMRPDRCSAPYMPFALFQPANFLQLAAYAAATIMLCNPSDYSGTTAPALKLGLCKSIGYCVGPAGIQGIGWRSYSLIIMPRLLKALPVQLRWFHHPCQRAKTYPMIQRRISSALCVVLPLDVLAAAVGPSRSACTILQTPLPSNNTTAMKR